MDTIPTITISKRRWELKEEARALRAQGLSYNDITRRVPVAKSTVSLWVRDVPLTDKQKASLGSRREASLVGVKAIQKMFWERRCDAFEEGKRLYTEYKNNPDFVAGLMLYWAEGRKAQQFSFTNSDSRMVQVIVRWLGCYFDIQPKKFNFKFKLAFRPERD